MNIESLKLNASSFKNKIKFLIFFSYLIEINSVMCVNAKSFLGPNEKLNSGEFLVSENGQFKMGCDKYGVLQIVDISEREISDYTLETKIFWYPVTSKYIIPSHRCYPSCLNNRYFEGLNHPFDGCFDTYRIQDLFIPCNKDGYLNAKFKESTAWSNGYNIERRQYKKFHDNNGGGCPLDQAIYELREMEINKGYHYNKDCKLPDTNRTLIIKGHQLFLSNSKGDILWHTEPVPYPKRFNRDNKYIRPWDQPINEPIYEETVNEAYLYLENCGRAILFTEEKILWCSCTYCICTVPMKLDYFENDPLISSLIKRRFRGMPSHSEAPASSSIMCDTSGIATSNSLKRTALNETKSSSNGMLKSLFARAKAECKDKN